MSLFDVFSYGLLLTCDDSWYEFDFEVFILTTKAQRVAQGTQVAA